MLNKYIEKYYRAQNFELSENRVTEIFGITIKTAVYEEWKEIDGIKCHSEMAKVCFEKNGLKHECDCYGALNIYLPVRVNGRDCVLFSKTLYGFTLLDAEALTEIYEYFPKAVLDGEESFIVAEVKQLDDILIFGGCYWAAPEECFAFDYHKKLFFNVSQELGILSNERIAVCGDVLILTGTDENGEEVEKSVSKQELCRLIEEKGTSEF